MPLWKIRFVNYPLITMRFIDLYILRQHCPDAGLIGTTNAKIDACKLLFGHGECFMDDTSVKKLLKDVRFKGRVRAVVDEAHFVIQW